jgi:MarR family transcriptional regulator, temperature-dependent positive regulator of motility
MQQEQLDLDLLRTLDAQPAASQRELAQGLGVSVGKLNYCLRALVQRGWVKASNFRRSDNKLAYAYLLTPRGAAAKMRLTSQFLKRKELEFEALQLQIEALREEISVPELTRHRRRTAEAVA